MRAKQIGKLLIACAIGVMFSVSLMAMRKGGQTWRRNLPDGFRATAAGVVYTEKTPAELVAIYRSDPHFDDKLHAAEVAGAKIELSPTHLAAIHAPAPGGPAPTTDPIDAATIAAVTGQIARLQGQLVPGVVFGHWQHTVQLAIDDLKAHINAETPPIKPVNVPPNLGAAQAALHNFEDFLARAVDPNAGPGGPAAIVIPLTRDFTHEYVDHAANPIVFATWHGDVQGAHDALERLIAAADPAAPNMGIARARLAELDALLLRPALPAGPAAPEIDLPATKVEAVAIIKEIRLGHDIAARMAALKAQVVASHDANLTAEIKEAVANLSVPPREATKYAGPRGFKATLGINDVELPKVR